MIRKYDNSELRFFQQAQVESTRFASAEGLRQVAYMADLFRPLIQRSSIREIGFQVQMSFVWRIFCPHASRGQAESVPTE